MSDQGPLIRCAGTHAADAPKRSRRWRITVVSFAVAVSLAGAHNVALAAPEQAPKPAAKSAVKPAPKRAPKHASKRAPKKAAKTASVSAANNAARTAVVGAATTATVIAAASTNASTTGTTTGNANNGLVVNATSNAALTPGDAERKPESTGGTLSRAEKALRDLGSKAKDTASDVTSYALSLIGVDYKFGGNTPDTGLDCSGLIRYVFQQATGISLPRTAREQARMGQSVAIDKLQPGDLVFFNTRRFQFSHVGLYVGDNRFVHAPSRGGAVEVVNLDQRYWQKTFNGARRVVSSLPELGLGVGTAEAAVPPAQIPVIAPTPATVPPLASSTRLSPAER